jgi:hypothetical protein
VEEEKKKESERRGRRGDKRVGRIREPTDDLRVYPD